MESKESLIEKLTSGVECYAYIGRNKETSAYLKLDNQHLIDYLNHIECDHPFQVSEHGEGNSIVLSIS